MAENIKIGNDYIYKPEKRCVRVRHTDKLSLVSKVGTPDENGLVWDEFWAFNYDLLEIPNKKGTK